MVRSPHGPPLPPRHHSAGARPRPAPHAPHGGGKWTPRASSVSPPWEGDMTCDFHVVHTILYDIYIYIYVLSNLQQHLTTLCTFHEHSGRHLAISNCKGSTLRQGEDCQLLHAGIADPSKLPEKSSNQSEPSMGGMRAGAQTAPVWKHIQSMCCQTSSST